MSRPSKFIKPEELLRVYFTIIINENNSLRILYFVKNGSQVFATMDNVQGRRAHPVNLKNNTLIFDADGDGNKVYRFVLSKSVVGQIIKLKSFEYKNLSLDTAYLQHAQVDKLYTATNFEDKVYQMMDMVDLPQPTKYLVFNGAKWSWTIFPYLIEDASSSYYKVTSRPWKGKSFGVDCIGVSINKYEGNSAKILVQKSDSPLVFLFTEN